ncbi:hypothetical protein LJC71_09645 [Desulfosarcina sp. OttesenSCG-928-A07]|nr:hypothetical protein [Desulfosarcina sp. OttesenSCG-928-A07]
MPVENSRHQIFRQSIVFEFFKKQLGKDNPAGQSHRFFLFFDEPPLFRQCALPLPFVMIPENTNFPAAGGAPWGVMAWKQHIDIGTYPVKVRPIRRLLA